MGSGHESTDYALKVAVAETELLAALRQVARPINELSRPGTRGVRRSLRKGTVIGWYSLRSGTFSFIGILHRSYAISFTLKPGTRTYRSFLEALIREISALERSGLALEGSRSAGESMALSASLENALQDRFGEVTRDEFAETVDVYPEDFEVFESEIPREAKEELIISGPGREGYLIPPDISIAEEDDQALADRDRAFRVFDRTGASYTTVTGLVSLQLETVTSTRLLIPEAAEEADLEVVHAPVSFLSGPRVEVEESGVDVSLEVQVKPEELSETELYLHWGRYDVPRSTWIDEEIFPSEITERSDGVFEIRKIIRPSTEGHYGVTCWAKSREDEERIWLGRPLLDDSAFVLVTGYAAQDPGEKAVGSPEERLRRALLRGLASFKRFVSTINSILKEDNARSLGKVLFDITKENPELRERISEYHGEALRALREVKSYSTKAKLNKVLSVLQILGIGEVVFVSPEGPHAIAGGLAQVIIGLTKSFNDLGVAATVITQLYEKSQGRKHKSAETILRDGVRIGDTVVELREVGRVAVSFGPTYVSGTRKVKEFPRVVHSRVYCAEYQNVRIFFLRHPRFASTLYGNVSSDEQLRRAIFLSRGALELLRSDSFGINPHILLTNDWMSGLVQAFLKTDPRYFESENLRGIHSVHVLHNCGRGYQGRLFVNQFKEDLWPLLGLSDEHFFGICDPNDRDHLNLTAAAIYHVDKALLAVSKPYAEQLMTKAGGEGLHKLIGRKAELVYGISNGIDHTALRLVCWQLGENARESLGFTPLAPEKFTESRLLKRLRTYKEAAKLVVQRSNSLVEDPDAVLISFVGRLAEQKGTALLSEKLGDKRMSVIETILSYYPEVQLIIGGPPSKNDPTVVTLLDELRILTQKYPGRVAGILDFIPHAEVLEITLGSDLFLMPSRYEPGGIAQLEALATGTLVIARNVGGLSATLVDYDESRGEGTAFLFEEYTGSALLLAMIRALRVCRDRKRRKALITEAAQEAHDWTCRTPQYLAMLQHIAGVWGSVNFYPYLLERYSVLQNIRAGIGSGLQ